MKLAQNHGCLCGRNTVDMLFPVFSELFSFCPGFQTEATRFPSALSTYDSQQLPCRCYYDTTKFEGQHDAMFSAACIA
jgi:hypothetical protein